MTPADLLALSDECGPGCAHCRARPRHLNLGPLWWLRDLLWGLFYLLPYALALGMLAFLAAHYWPS